MGSKENVPQRCLRGSKAGNQKQGPNGTYSVLSFYKYTYRHISYSSNYSFKKCLLSICYGFNHHQESRFLPSWGPTRVTQVVCGGQVTGGNVQKHGGWGARGPLGIGVGRREKGSRDHELDRTGVRNNVVITVSTNLASRVTVFSFCPCIFSNFDTMSIYYFRGFLWFAKQFHPAPMEPPHPSHLWLLPMLRGASSPPPSPGIRSSL